MKITTNYGGESSNMAVISDNLFQTIRTLRGKRETLYQTKIRGNWHTFN